MEETWRIYKKTKHRVGFQTPEGRDFRLPRPLVPEEAHVGRKVRAEWDQRPGESVLALSLADSVHPQVVSEPGEGDEIRDRWLVWKVRSDWVGITGAPLSNEHVKTTGKFKLPPHLLPKRLDNGDQVLVVVSCTEVSARWAMGTM